MICSTLARLCTVPLVLALLAGSAQAATFWVDTSADAVDTAPGDGSCATSLGDCTLRAAIMEANASPGFDKVLVATDVVLSIPWMVYGEEETDPAQGDIELEGDVAIVGVPSDGELPLILQTKSSRIFHVRAGARVLVALLYIEGGNSDFGGGAILNEAGASLSLSRLEIRRNFGFRGGGLDNFGSVEVADCLFERNNGGYENGSAIRNRGTLTVRRTMIVDHQGEDGAISNSGTALIEDSTISRNTGEDPGGILNALGAEMTLLRTTVSENSGDEGGILNYGVIRILNSTVSRNRGREGGAGIAGGGRIFLIASTVTENVSEEEEAPQGGGLTGGEVFVQASVIAGNTSANGKPDCSGTITSLGHNIVGDDSGCSGFDQPTDLIGSSAAPIDPVLGPLADNGGPSETHLPLAGSPVIDAIPPRDCRFDLDGDPLTPRRRLLTDQRGVLRVGGACDIGSVEVAHRGCGNGFSSALIVPVLAWGWRRRR